jgi:hypothetical protein
MPSTVADTLEAMDWKRWHDKYDDPGSPFARRLATVRDRIGDALDEAAGRAAARDQPVRRTGQGPDPRARRAPARPRRARAPGRARPRQRRPRPQLAADAGLTRVEVVTGDASLTDQYLDLVPANLVLICGVYGNLRLPDIENTVAACTALCATGGTVIWTRGREPEPAVAPQICAWYEQAGFEQVWLAAPEEQMCVGAHRHTGATTPLEPGVSMFRFIGYDALYRQPSDNH